MTAKIKLNAASGGGSFSLQAPSSSANTRVMTLPDTADGTILTTTNPKAGNIIQVVEGSTQSRVSITSGTGTWVDTNLKASITPSSSSNKIFVLVNGTLFTGNNSSAAATVFRGGTGGTNIGDSTYGLFQGNASPSTSAGAVMGCNLMKLDSPSTTSATEYIVKIKRVFAGSGGDTLFPASNNLEISTITLMEVAA